MKWLIASDIHGNALYCEKLLKRFRDEDVDRMLLLGDILYHGPRNGFNQEYDPARVVVLLNGIKDEVIGVRGNCDAEIDQMVLEFPILSDYTVIDLGDRMVFATHGHLYDNLDSLHLKAGSLVLSGHTHVPVCRIRDGVTFMNPGSVSMPKNGSPHSYMILQDGKFIWKNIDGEEYFLPELD